MAINKNKNRGARKKTQKNGNTVSKINNSMTPLSKINNSMTPLSKINDSLNPLSKIGSIDSLSTSNDSMNDLPTDSIRMVHEITDSITSITKSIKNINLRDVLYLIEQNGHCRKIVCSVCPLILCKYKPMGAVIKKNNTARYNYIKNLAIEWLIHEYGEREAKELIIEALL